VRASPRQRRSLAVVLVLFGQACSSPSGPSGHEGTITIGPGGVSPRELRVKAWAHVTFVNEDNRAHTIVSDPVDRHTDCPPINAVGVITPGQRRTSATLNLPARCGFHDHDNPTDTKFAGLIIVE
jgi:plastocyanin